jgi:hypothetical protein
MATKRDDDGIDYTAEGTTPPHEKNDSTNAGYDEAANKGGAYGVKEGEGGVFGTSGGGTYSGGMHKEERDTVDTVGRGDEPGSEEDKRVKL